MDYSNSHVVTSYQYLIVLKHKVMDKKIVEKIKELKAKEKEKRISKKVESTLTQFEWTPQRRIKKDNGVKFNDAWSTIVVKVNSERFHENVKVGFQPIL